MLRVKNIKFLNPYSVGEEVEFFNRYGKWVKCKVIGFKITNFVFKAILQCENKNCYGKHYICICSLYLRKVK